MAEDGRRSEKRRGTLEVRKLSDAIREVKNFAADRSDAISDRREAARARLDVLVEELRPVIDDLPEEEPLFDFVVSSGLEPRLWIAAVTHIDLGRDLRTYRFVRDGRSGRTVIAESASAPSMANRVTLYVAERIVEREQLRQGEPQSLFKMRDAPARAAAESGSDADGGSGKGGTGEKRSLRSALNAFLAILLLLGLIGIGLYAWIVIYGGDPAALIERWSAALSLS